MLCGHRGRETDQNRVAAGVHTATEHLWQQDGVAAEKMRKRVRGGKLGEAEVVFFYIDAACTVQIGSVHVPFFCSCLFCTNSKLGLLN
jgi:hypothetical protein